MKILVTGASGQLGKSLAKYQHLYPATHFEFADRKAFDLTNAGQMLSYLQRSQPDCIINAAAYTQVDNAELTFELARIINADALAIMGHWAASQKKKIIHFSTDYVFDGSANIPYQPNQEKNPINLYGRSKSLGEDFLMQSGAEYIIIRTSWVFSEFGHNFLKTMLRLFQSRSQVKIVSDQLGKPTYAGFLAEAALTMAHSADFVTGVYHYANEPATSWHGFAEKIKSSINSQVELIPISTNEFPTCANRPKYSVLNTSKIFEVFPQIPPKDWWAGISESLEILQNC